MTDKFDIYQHVTDRLIDLMETEGTNWSKPWRASGVRAFNVVSGRIYSGVNPLMLAHRQCPAWASFKQWQEKGYSVQKGEKSTIVVFWKRVVTEDKETGEKKTIPLLRYYRVFNGEQVRDANGNPFKYELPEIVTNDIERVANADRVINETGAKINHLQGDRAFYSVNDDAITMPLIGQFENVAGYYGTLLHELGHWTGHKSRLDRQFGKRFGSQAYAFEELVAEFTSAFLGARLEIDSEPRADHAQYLNNWLSVLRDDKKAIFTAISAAKKASEFIYPETKEEEEELAA